MRAKDYCIDLRAATGGAPVVVENLAREHLYFFELLSLPRFEEATRILPETRCHCLTPTIPRATWRRRSVSIRGGGRWCHFTEVRININGPVCVWCVQQAMHSCTFRLQNCVGCIVSNVSVQYPSYTRTIEVRNVPEGPLPNMTLVEGTRSTLSSIPKVLCDLSCL